MKNDQTREIILDAAQSVIKRTGLKNLTLDAVAAEVGLSKGGLLHYFPNKREIVVNMILRFQRRFFQLRDKVMLELPEKKTRRLKATILVLLRHLTYTSDSFANIGSLFEDPDLANIIAAIRAEIFEDVCAGCRSPEKIVLIMLLVDGLWMANTFCRAPYSKAERDAVVEKLLDFVDSMEEDCAPLDAFA